MSQASIPPKRRKAQLMRTLQGGAYQKKRKRKRKASQHLASALPSRAGKAKGELSCRSSFRSSHTHAFE